MKLTFTDTPLDHAGLERGDPDWIAARLNDRKAQAVLFAGGDLALDDQGQPMMMRAKYAARLPLKPPGLVFLGVQDGIPWFAAMLEPGVADKGPDFRMTAMHAPPELACVFGRARALLLWHKEHLFCSNCGEATRLVDGGARRTCDACGTDHYPRVNPSVIMLPYAGDRCVLGRQKGWPAGMYATLAGFMEPGETIERACAREIAEESHLTTLKARYVASQPWPFPASLMIGLLAEVEPGDLIADDDLEDAQWFTAEEVRTLYEGEMARWAPPHFSISRMLIDCWMKGERA